MLEQAGLSPTSMPLTMLFPLPGTPFPFPRPRAQYSWSLPLLFLVWSSTTFCNRAGSVCSHVSILHGDTSWLYRVHLRILGAQGGAVHRARCCSEVMVVSQDSCSRYHPLGPAGFSVHASQALSPDHSSSLPECATGGEDSQSWSGVGVPNGG